MGNVLCPWSLPKVKPQGLPRSRTRKPCGGMVACAVHFPRPIAVAWAGLVSHTDQPLSDTCSQRQARGVGDMGSKAGCAGAHL